MPYADRDGDARLIALEIEKAVAGAWPFAPCAFDFVEMLEPVFFRGKGAYLVGRVVRGARALPLIVALLNRDDRIWVDAVLLTEAEASVVFSFTRSYFHVDVEAPAGMIRFLKGIMPRKPVGRALHQPRLRQARQDRALPRSAPPPLAARATASRRRAASGAS